ncbi:mitochondrial large ribosomal subunit protein uL15m [archaeon]|nr:mitochondrial large ribosomal subunit protein uL15m [archaeon]
MKLKKRTKKTRMRGARTCGYGFRQKHKGHGNGGGFGMAGTGKRADHMKQVALEMAVKAGFKTYFGKQGFTSASTEKKKNKQINLEDLQKNFLGKEKVLDFSDYKILGKGEGFKATIKALSASKSAIEKMKKAGGEIIMSEKKITVEEVKEIVEEVMQPKKKVVKKKKK